MQYVKPELQFQKFHTDAYLGEDLSSGGGGHGGQIFGGTDGFNVDVTFEASGVGGWFNG